MKPKKFNSFFAFALALTYIIGILCLIFVFHGFETNSNIVEDKIQYLLRHKTALQSWYFFIYIINITNCFKIIFKSRNYFIH